MCAGLASYTRMCGRYGVIAGPDAGGQGTTVYAPGSKDGEALPAMALPEDQVTRGEYPVLYPNLLTGIQADHFYLIEVVPMSPAVTRERFDIFFFGDAAMDDAHRAIREQTIERWNDVFVEDIDIVERLQQGHASPAATRGRFSQVPHHVAHQFQRSSPHSAVVHSICARLPICPANQSIRPAAGRRTSNWRAVNFLRTDCACAS